MEDMTRGAFLKKLGLSLAGLGVGSVITETMITSASATATAPGLFTPLAVKPESNSNFISQGSGIGNRIAITFDDGPTPKVTEKILEELRRRNIRSTFFMIGKRIKANPNLAREVLAAGHEIANHTYTHPFLSKLSNRRVHYEIEKCQGIIMDKLGVRPKWFRPPYGAFKKRQAPIPTKNGLGVVFWNVDTNDWRRPGVKKIVNIVNEQTKPGAIILMHDLYAQTARAVPYILDNLLRSEFVFTPITPFLGVPFPRIHTLRALPIG